MSDDDPFSDWYNEGEPLPVCHPIPECSATIEFTDEHTIRWAVTNHKNGNTYVEEFAHTGRTGASEAELMGKDDE